MHDLVLELQAGVSLFLARDPPPHRLARLGLAPCQAVLCRLALRPTALISAHQRSSGGARAGWREGQLGRGHLLAALRQRALP